MTSNDMHSVYTALAFMSVVTRGGEVKPENETEQILSLATQVKAFCDLYVPKVAGVDVVNAMNVTEE